MEVDDNDQAKHLADSYDRLIQKVTNSDEKLRATGLLDDEFNKQVDQLNQFCIQVLSYAHEYDFDSSHPYNGFRTFVKIVDKYFERVASLVPTNSCKLPLKSVKAHLDYLPLLTHQVESLKIFRQLKDVKEDDLESQLQIELKIQSHQLKLTEKQLEPFFSPLTSGFWLPKSIADFMNKGMVRKAVLIYYPLHQAIPALFSTKKTTKLAVDKAVNGSIAEVDREKKLWAKMMSLKPPKNATVTVFNLTKRQNSFIIDSEAKKVVLNENQGQLKNNKSIKLVIVKPKERKSDQVIYHLHGGGWVLGKPEVYFGPMEVWIAEIGATIISIDYSLAPDEIYPVALQEITDTYIWLDNLMNKKESNEQLDFVPSDILVTGDSAGGNLTLSLAIVLAEIIKLSPGAVKLPKALAPLYPAVSPALPYLSASGVLMDVLCSWRLKFPSVYLAKDIVDPKISYLNGKNNPFFKDEAKCREIYMRFNRDRKSDPILHIFTYQSFDLLKDVPLYIQAAEFDALLDDAITVAKLWKGKVVLDVLPDVVHAFSLLRKMSPECKKADQLVVQRMKEALT